jgi:NADPH:quinone reductase
MKAVGLYNYLPTQAENCFVDVELAAPVATGFDLLIEVKAMSVNPVDTKVRMPKEKTENPARVLGWDAAGIVKAVGENCQRFKVGDKVYYAGDLTRAGSNAQYQLVDERITGHMPASLTFEEAAALPLTTITAWEGLFNRLSLRSEATAEQAKKSLLIIAGAGGVGSVATQIAKKVAGIGQVITTASRDETRAWCQEMGADLSIDHTQPLLPQLQQHGIDGVDYIFCCAPTEVYFEQMADVIKPQGAICTIVETTGDVSLPMNKLQGKSVSFCWEFMFTRSMYKTSDISEQHVLLNRVAELVDSGTLKTTLTEVIGPLSAINLIEAHRKLESGKTIGKVVLSEIEG